MIFYIYKNPHTNDKQPSAPLRKIAVPHASRHWAALPLRPVPRKDTVRGHHCLYCETHGGLSADQGGTQWLTDFLWVRDGDLNVEGVPRSLLLQLQYKCHAASGAPNTELLPPIQGNKALIGDSFHLPRPHLKATRALLSHHPYIQCAQKALARLPDSGNMLQNLLFQKNKNKKVYWRA